MDDNWWPLFNILKSVLSKIHSEYILWVFDIFKIYLCCIRSKIFANNQGSSEITTFQAN